MNRAVRTDWARAAERELLRWGATWVRTTSQGHKRYRLGTVYVDVTDSGSDWREQRNLQARIQRAIRQYRAAHPMAQPRDAAPHQEATMGDVTIETLLAQPPQPHVPFGTVPGLTTTDAEQELAARFGQAATVTPETPTATAPDAAPPQEETTMGKAAIQAQRIKTLKASIERLKKAGPYPCPDCGRPSPTPGSLAKHRSHAHGVPGRRGVAAGTKAAAPRPEPLVTSARDVAQRAVDAVAVLVRENADLRHRLAEIEQSLSAMGVLRDKAKDALRGR